MAIPAQAGDPADWDIVWPTRRGTVKAADTLALAMGLEPISDGRETVQADEYAPVPSEPSYGPNGPIVRPDLPWGDLAWERQMLARHLDSWLMTTHCGSGFGWPATGPKSVDRVGSFLADLALLLRDEFVAGPRVFRCEGSVRVVTTDLVQPASVRFGIAEKVERRVERVPCPVTWTQERERLRTMDRMCRPCWDAARQAERKGGRT